MKNCAAIQMASGPDVEANLLEAGRLISAAADAGAGLLVLPENFALMGRTEFDKLDYMEDAGDGIIQQFLADTARHNSVWIVGGTMPMVASVSGKIRASCLIFDDRGQQVARYDKMHLVPFGEYVPFADLLDFAGPLVKEVGGFSPGSKFTLGQVSGAQFASLICFEGIFPELARGFVLSGAQILINITNDTWYGTTAAPLQHLQIGAFRAIEQRRSLLRCANSGYSAHIDSTGAILQQMDLFQEGLLLTEVKTSSYRSIYSRVGEWINISAVVFVLLIFLTLVVRRRGGSG